MKVEEDKQKEIMGIMLQKILAITNIGGQSISAAAASEAFDEPLTKEQITAIVTPFFA